MTISAFCSGNEFIEITKEHNNSYYIHYGIGYSKNTGNKYSNCFAGGFNKYADALQILKKHRPHAKQIKTYCIKCRARKMLAYDPKTKTSGYCDCAGEPFDTVYTGCIYQNMKPLKKYTVCFIDGHDLRYKTVDIETETKEKAVEKVFNMYGSNFEHKLTGIFEHD